MRPPSNVASSPSTSAPVPGMTSGRVSLIVPSARERSGLVKTSSVGRLGIVTTPLVVVRLPPVHWASGNSPTVKSVPSPL